ncbi:hypothetical protein [Goodfellowiella coeruleoviolacea]|nr:hypothetical protein [Goodfellowiella coeruleoviolacea]
MAEDDVPVDSWFGPHPVTAMARLTAAASLTIFTEFTLSARAV